MLKYLSAAVFTVGLIFAPVAEAQTCNSFLNTQIAPWSFADAARAIQGGGAALTKDEFETTAQFEARIAAATSTMPASIFVSTPIDLEYVTYNADAGAFEVRSYALKNNNIHWFSALYGSPYYDTIRTGTSNIDIVISDQSRTTGTYTGKNGYGAEWEVSEVDNTVEAIFERAGNYSDSLFPNAGSAVWSIPVPLDQARGFKEKLNAAVLIVPKAPYYFENSQPGPGRVTVQNPRDVTQISHIMVADIQCVVVTDEAHNVLLAITTN